MVHLQILYSAEFLVHKSKQSYHPCQPAGMLFRLSYFRDMIFGIALVKIKYYIQITNSFHFLYRKNTKVNFEGE